MSELIFGNYLDAIIFIITSISLIFGLYRGLVYSVIATFGTIVSFFLALVLFSYVKDYLSTHIHNDLILNTVTIIASYGIASIFVAIINYFIRKLIGPFRGGIIDRILGVMFGIARGIFFSLVIFWILIFLYDDKIIEKLDDKEEFFKVPNSEIQPKWIKNSNSFNILIMLSKEIYNKLSKEQLKDIKNNFSFLKNSKNKDLNNEDSIKKDKIKKDSMSDKESLLRLNEILEEVSNG